MHQWKNYNSVYYDREDFIENRRPGQHQDNQHDPLQICRNVRCHDHPAQGGVPQEEAEDRI